MNQFEMALKALDKEHARFVSGLGTNPSFLQTFLQGGVIQFLSSGTIDPIDDPDPFGPGGPTIGEPPPVTLFCPGDQQECERICREDRGGLCQYWECMGYVGPDGECIEIPACGPCEGIDPMPPPPPQDPTDDPDPVIV